MTRRTLARLLASAAAAPVAVVPAAAQSGSDDDQQAAAQRLANAQQLDQVKLPMATEPAFHFKA